MSEIIELNTYSNRTITFEDITEFTISLAYGGIGQAVRFRGFYEIINRPDQGKLDKNFNMTRKFYHGSKVLQHQVLISALIMSINFASVVMP